MQESDEIPLFPVADWLAGPIPAYSAVMIKFDFLSNPLQSPDHPTEGRHYVLSTPQAAELAQTLQKAVDHLKTASSQAPPEPSH